MPCSKDVVTRRLNKSLTTANTELLTRRRADRGATVRERTRRRFRPVGSVLLAGTLVGIGYGSLIGFAGWGAPVMGGLFGAIHGFTIAACISFLEVFATRTRLGRRLEAAPLAVTIAVKGLVYGRVIAAVEFGDLGERLVRGRPADPAVQLSVAFSFVFTFTFIFVLHVARLVGGADPARPRGGPLSPAADRSAVLPLR